MIEAGFGIALLPESGAGGARCEVAREDCGARSRRRQSRDGGHVTERRSERGVPEAAQGSEVGLSIAGATGRRLRTFHFVLILFLHRVRRFASLFP